MKFGDRLRQAREARGVTLDAIAAETHIARHYLEALERSDLDALPGAVFNKGYIRSYAQFVGVDPQSILGAYQIADRRHNLATPESDRRMLQALSFSAERRSGSKTRWPFLSSALGISIVSLVLALLAAGGWLLISGRASVDDFSSGSSRRAVVSEPLAPSSEMDDSPEEKEAPERRASEDEPDGSGLAVPEAALGTGIVDRTVVGTSDRFSEGTRVFFWTRVVGGEQGVVLRHIWRTGDEVVMSAPLVVGGPHWRTYSSYTLPPGSAGSWTVEARSPDGRVLARREFGCFSSPDLETRRRAILRLSGGD